VLSYANNYLTSNIHIPLSITMADLSFVLNPEETRAPDIIERVGILLDSIHLAPSFPCFSFRDWRYYIFLDPNLGIACSFKIIVEMLGWTLK
jgi:hypothetical protein